jgi:hypothetical protein
VASTVCYTAVFGHYDTLGPAPAIPGIECVAFTDDPDLCAPGWDVRVIPAAGHHPRMAAKRFKLLPHVYLPDAERTVWVDGGHRISGSQAVEQALSHVGPAGIALHRHPGRDCIYDEALASLQFAKYDGQPICDQAAAYRRQKHPEHWGLWACGSIARVRSDALDAAMDDWWNENVLWSYQDQISFPVVMRRAGLRPAEFPYQQYASPWFSVGGHLRDD